MSAAARGAHHPRPLLAAGAKVVTYDAEKIAASPAEFKPLFTDLLTPAQACLRLVPLPSRVQLHLVTRSCAPLIPAPLRCGAQVCVTLVRQQRGDFQNVAFMGECIKEASLLRPLGTAHAHAHEPATPPVGLASEPGSPPPLAGGPQDVPHREDGHARPHVQALLLRRPAAGDRPVLRHHDRPVHQGLHRREHGGGPHPLPSRPAALATRPGLDMLRASPGRPHLCPTQRPPALAMALHPLACRCLPS